MFDIGIMELGLIAVVALLVIGPERLPAVARTVGFWFGKVRKFVSSVQDDFNREVIKSEELKRLVEEQAKIKDVHEIIEHTIDESRKTVSTGAKLATEQTEQTEQKDTPQLEGQGAGQEQHESPKPESSSTTEQPRQS
ncbi:Sec-independent protein translocase protein TatB [Kaarinaea lacus]